MYYRFPLNEHASERVSDHVDRSAKSITVKYLLTKEKQFICVSQIAEVLETEKDVQFVVRLYREKKQKKTLNYFHNKRAAPFHPVER